MSYIKRKSTISKRKESISNEKRIVSALLIIAMCFTFTVNAFAANMKTEDVSIQTAVEAFNSLTAEQKNYYLTEIETLAQNGDFTLIDFHTQHIDSNYTYNEQIRIASVSSSIALQLQSLGLPSAVYSILISMASSISSGTLPLAAAAALGVASVIANNWDSVEEFFDSIVDIFYDEYGSDVEDAFVYVYEVSTFNGTTYDLSDNTITTRTGDTYRCRTKAENANLSENAFYPALRGDDGKVYIATNKQLTVNEAKVLMHANSEFIGIFTTYKLRAYSFVAEHGGGFAHSGYVEYHGDYDNQEGFWSHYHPLVAPSCHVWFAEKSEDV